MDQDRIEQENIIDRYLNNQLDEATRAEFTNYFMNNDQCLDELELSESFQAGLRDVTAQEATKAVVAGGILHFLQRRMALVGGVMAALVVVLVAPLLLNRTPTNVPTPVIELASATRSAGVASVNLHFGEGQDRITLQRKVLVAKNAPPPAFRATITDSENRIRFQLLDAARNGQVQFDLKREQFEPGAYMLQIELERGDSMALLSEERLEITTE